MKKKLGIAAVAVTVLLGIIWYFFFWTPLNKVQPIYLVPQNAIYILESEEPVSNWKEISTSEPWRHLKQNKYFAELTADAESLDSLIQENSGLLDFFGNQPLYISAHQYKSNDYDFLYIVDIGKASRFTGIKSYIGKLTGSGYRVTYRKYKQYEIVELYDEESRDTLYMVFVENLLLASYTHTLVESAIDEYEDPVIGRDIAFIDVSKQVGYDGMFRVFLQYRQLDEYVKILMGQENEYVNAFSESLLYSSFAFEMDDNLLELTGYTNFQSETNSYLKASYLAGEGAHDILNIAPKRTAFYLGLGFEAFNDFVSSLEKVLENDPVGKKEYEDGRKAIEGFLKIDLQENFIDWVDEELAFIQTQPKVSGRAAEYALVLKAKEEDQARENLDFIRQQIKKRTPVKVKSSEYKGYKIHYLSIKGFFKLFLGKLFARFDKPYYAIVEDYVIFSNHPQTIKNMIDDYQNKEVLTASERFEDFYDELSGASSAFAYINTPALFASTKSLVSPQKWQEMVKNKPYIVCFDQIGLQLKPADETFESRLLANFVAPVDVPDKHNVIAQKTLEGKVTSKNKMATVVEYTISSDKIGIITENKQIMEDLEKVDEIPITDTGSKEQKAYHDNGKLAYSIELSNGIKEGKFRAYHQNGELKFRGKYENDNKEGQWRVYNVFGEQIGKLYYENGRLKK